MIVTLEWLQDIGACGEAIQAYKKYGSEEEGRRAIEILLQGHEVLARYNERTRLQWASWLVIKLMTNEQRIQYAIFSAEQVLPYYEAKYPADDRPRKAIEAAKACLDSALRNEAACSSAHEAACSSAHLADAAHMAALAAYEVVYAVTHTAANAAGAAAHTEALAAYAEALAACVLETAAHKAAYNKMLTKIIKYGIKFI